MPKSLIIIDKGERPDFKILSVLKEFSGVFKSLRYRRPRWPYCSKPWCPSSRIYLEDLGVFIEVSAESPLRGRVTPVGSGLLTRLLSSSGSLGPGSLHGALRTKLHELLVSLSTKLLGEEPPGRRKVELSLKGGELKRVEEAVVIGGGASGLSAALKLSEYGIKVLVIDLDRRPGGFLDRLEKVKGSNDIFGDIVNKALEDRNVKLLRGKYIGSYEEGKFVLTDKDLLLVPHDRPLIYAGGSTSPPPITYNNDLPGVVSLDYALELIGDGAFRPRRAAVLGSSSWALEVAESLASLGIRTYLFSLREGLGTERAEMVKVEKVWFEGLSNVKYVRTEDRRIEVDIVISALNEFPLASPLYAVGYEPCLNVKGVMVPKFDLEEVVKKDLIIPAGSVLGIDSVDFAIKSGECAGTIVASILGSATEDEVKYVCTDVIEKLEEEYNCDGILKERPEVWLSGDVDGLQFVDLDEDLLLKDVVEAWRKGYNDMESLKRATGLGTGLDQGIFSAHSSALILSYIFKTRPSSIGLFRSRPPHSLPLAGILERFSL